ncbi:unnamed protein product [Caenorhabditis brenneri]
MSDKVDPKGVPGTKKAYENGSDDLREKYHKMFDKECEDYYDSEAYNDKESRMAKSKLKLSTLSGWVIFLIILLVLGLLAGGAAAFWFFYWKRKYGGKEEMIEENTESTENSKTVIEIPVGTY